MDVVRGDRQPGARLGAWFWGTVKRVWHSVGPAQLIRGFGGFQVLVAGSRLGLFDLLEERPNLGLPEICAALELPEHTARALMLSSTALGLTRLDSRRGTYRNSRLMKRFWSPESKPRMRPSLEAFHELMYQPFYLLTESIKRGTNVGLDYFPGAGQTLYERLESRPDAKRVFHAWMEAMGENVNRVPQRVVDALRGTHRLLDVGGGDAKNAIELARRVDGLTVTIFDLPLACELARSNVSAARLEHRVSTTHGNFLSDALPDGFDAILFAHIFNIYSAETNEAVIRKCADVLQSGGKLIIYNLVSHEDQTGPWHAAFMSLYFQALATGEGFVYPPDSYEKWFEAAGFRSLQVHIGAKSGEGIFIGTK